MRKILNIGFGIAWIIWFATSLTLLTIFSAWVESKLLTFMPKGVALFEIYAMLVIIVFLPRQIIKKKWGIDVILLNTFFERSKSDNSKPTIKPYF